MQIENNTLEQKLQVEFKTITVLNINTTIMPDINHSWQLVSKNPLIFNSIMHPNYESKDLDNTLLAPIPDEHKEVIDQADVVMIERDTIGFVSYMEYCNATKKLVQIYSADQGLGSYLQYI